MLFHIKVFLNIDIIVNPNATIIDNEITIFSKIIITIYPTYSSCTPP